MDGGQKIFTDILNPHVSFNVSNIDASAASYEKAFGVTVMNFSLSLYGGRDGVEP
ncbi:Hypothetical protein A7982_07903 [Minicystis rosea]|nr:Hypothetical protein A7982_07903 [Minicystis rosea]